MGLHTTEELLARFGDEDGVMLGTHNDNIILLNKVNGSVFIARFQPAVARDLAKQMLEAADKVEGGRA